MKKLPKLAVIIALLVMCVAFMTMTAYAEDPTVYDLWINGEQVTSANLSGTNWSFAPASGSTPDTITLTGTGDVAFTSQHEGYAIYSDMKKALAINLNGGDSYTIAGIFNNGEEKTSGSYSYIAYPSVTISGTGSPDLTISTSSGYVAGAAPLAINNVNDVTISGSHNKELMTGNGMISAAGNVEVVNDNGALTNSSLSVSDAADVTLSGYTAASLASGLTIDVKGDVSVINNGGYISGPSATIKGGSIEIVGKNTSALFFNSLTLDAKQNTKAGGGKTSGNITMTNDIGALLTGALNIGDAADVELKGNVNDSMLKSSISIKATGDVSIANESGYISGLGGTIEGGSIDITGKNTSALFFSSLTLNAKQNDKAGGGKTSGNITMTNEVGGLITGALTIGDAADVELKGNINDSMLQSTISIKATGDVSIANESGYISGLGGTIEGGSIDIAGKNTSALFFSSLTLNAKQNDKAGGGKTSGNITMTNEVGGLLTGALTIGDAADVELKGNVNDSMLQSTISIKATGDVSIANESGYISGLGGTIEGGSIDIVGKNTSALFFSSLTLNAKQNDKAGGGKTSGSITMTNDVGGLVDGSLTVTEADDVTLSGNSSASLATSMDITASGLATIINSGTGPALSNSLSFTAGSTPAVVFGAPANNEIVVPSGNTVLVASENADGKNAKLWYANDLSTYKYLSTGYHVSKAEINVDGIKNEYDFGEELDVSGATIKYTRTDGTNTFDETIPVTPAMVSGFDSSTAGKQTLTVNFAGYTATYDVTVYYRVKFDANGHGSGKLDDLLTTDGVVTFADYGFTPHKGYEFVGWALSPNGEALTGTSYTATDNVTLYAKWNIITYNVAYELNGGTLVGTNPATYTVESDITLLEPTKDGYKFGGWYKESTFENKVEKLSGGLAEDLTLYAKFGKEVTVVDSKAATTGAGIYIAGETVTIHAGTRSGYTFKGWTTEDGVTFASSGSFDTTFVMPDKEVTVKANWKKKPVEKDRFLTLTFNTNGGKAMPSETFAEGTTVNLSYYAPQYEGHTLDGWYTDTTYTVRITSVTMTDNTTIHARWIEDRPITPTTPTEPTKPSIDSKRLAGGDRIDTAIAISKESGDSADTVVLANCFSYADALAGTSYAAAVNAPILLTGAESLDARTLAEIERLGAKKVTLLGGNSAISEAVEKALEGKGIAVTRLAGDDRFGTAIAVAKELANLKGGVFDTIYLASGVNYPDALSISPVAAIEQNPVLYLPANGTPDTATAEYLKSLGCKKAVILGGVAAVGANAENTLAALGMTTERINGADRYATSLAIVKRYDALFTGKGMAVATGKNFPDALAGAAFAAQRKMPVVLVGDSVPADLAAYAASRKPENLYVFGGSNAVSDGVVAKLVG